MKLLIWKLETQVSFMSIAVELKMKVFMTCKVPLSTPHFGRFGKLGDLNKKIAMAIEYSGHHYNSS